MKSHNSKVNTFNVLLIVALCFTLLTACSTGNAKQSSTGAPSVELEARQGALAAQQELPKLAKSENSNVIQNPPQPTAQENVPADQPPAAADLPSVRPAAVEIAPVQPAAAGMAPVQPLAAQPAAAPVVDPSIAVGPQKGLRAPDFTMQTLDGQSVRLSDLVGRPVVISYWATWCIPCKQELPILQQIQQEYQDQGLIVLSVNATDQDDLTDVQSLVGEMGMTFPVLLDQGKQFADTYQALFFPTTFYIDASGVIREIKLGDSSEADLRQKIQGLMVGGL
jgi:thiol-disulfide isomerase/thioredoxin